MERQGCDILELFDQRELVKVCAPMVRYSKLQFRNLVKKYDCDLCYTPMILADSFCKSEKARNNEFTTNLGDTPLVTQFAANTAHEFVGATHLVSPYCDGVDLNCGCPQTWAKQMGIGCALLNTPDVIYDMVRQCRNRVTKPFTVSVKLRILKDLRKTVEICRQLEKMGVSYLTVHAREPHQSTGEINLESLQLIQDAINIPLIANGGVKSLEDCWVLQQKTRCKGVMVANGILTNPAIFAGHNIIPTDCIQDWLNICFNSTLTEEKHLYMIQNAVKPFIPRRPYNLTFQTFHHHLVFMLEKLLPKSKRQIINNCKNFDDALAFMENEFGICPRLFSSEEFNYHKLLNVNYDARLDVYNELKPVDNDDVENAYDYSASNGKYFESKMTSVADEDSSDCDWSELFLDSG